MTQKSVTDDQTTSQKPIAEPLHCAVCHQVVPSKTRKTRRFKSGLEGLVCARPRCERTGVKP